MYESFQGLTGSPFRLGPDPRFFYESGGHGRALAQLSHGLAQQEGFVVVTGEAGTGKTTLVGKLLSGLEPGRYIHARLAGARVDAVDFLRLVAGALHLPFKGLDKASLLELIRVLLAECERQGKRPLLVVDEAQNMGFAALEELRLLTNLQSGHRALLQCILIAQPSFRDCLSGPSADPPAGHSADPTMEQFRQRVVAACHLSPLTRDETRAYIQHRLRRVGWTRDPDFSPGAFDYIHRHCGGVPRRINRLCGRLLAYAGLEKLSYIDEATAAEIAHEMEDEIGPLNRAAGEEPARLPAHPSGAASSPASNPSAAAARSPDTEQPSPRRAFETDFDALKELARRVESVT